MVHWWAHYVTEARFFKIFTVKCQTELISDELWSKSQSVILTGWKQLKIITYQNGFGFRRPRYPEWIWYFLQVTRTSDSPSDLEESTILSASSNKTLPSAPSSTEPSHNTHQQRLVGRRQFQSRPIYQYYKFYNIPQFGNTVKPVNNSPKKKMTFKKSCKQWGLRFDMWQLARTALVTKAISNSRFIHHFKNSITKMCFINKTT